MENYIANALTHVLARTASAWLTVPVSVRRFRSEKLWERRLHAYERVLDALYHSKAFFDKHMDAFRDGREVPEETNEQLGEKLRAARLEIEKAVDVDAIIVGVEASERLRRYLAEAKKAGKSEDWFGYLDSNLAAVDACLGDLTRIAKREL